MQNNAINIHMQNHRNNKNSAASLESKGSSLNREQTSLQDQKKFSVSNSNIVTQVTDYGVREGKSCMEVMEPSTDVNKIELGNQAQVEGNEKGSGIDQTTRPLSYKSSDMVQQRNRSRQKVASKTQSGKPLLT